MTLTRQARFVKVAALLSLDHLEDLLDSLGPFVLARTGAVLERDAVFLTKEDLLFHYKIYIEAIENGEDPNPKVRPFLSTTLAPCKASFTLDFVDGIRCIARAGEPCIQLRYHVLAYSPIDHSFHSMALGKETVPWGIQFSFAGLVERRGVVEEVDRTAPAAQQFRILQKWLRHNTEPACFRGPNWERRISARISPQLVKAINAHPALDGLEVA